MILEKQRPSMAEGAFFEASAAWTFWAERIPTVIWTYTP